MHERTVLITGGSGFIGLAVGRRLLRDGAMRVRVATRRPSAPRPPGVEPFLVGDLGPAMDWTSAVRGVDVVVHTAARVHVMRETAVDPLVEFRRDNVEGTVALSRQAVGAGVRRLVFVSSIKVNGEVTRRGEPFRADSAPAPIDPYGISKLEAELALREIASETGLEIVVIRPVLVYGPGVGGNFRSMMHWLDRGLPLPLAAIDNRRSLVALDNVADLIATCTYHAAAADKTFLVSDGEDLSTPELLRRTAAAMGVRARLFPIPVQLLKATARLTGRGPSLERLTGSLQVDSAPTRATLGWSPVTTVDAALAETAADFRRSRG